MFEWSEEYSVGVSIIDDDHKKLVSLINEADIAKQNGEKLTEIMKILNDMVLYARRHFKMEEAYMDEFKYLDYQSHKSEHLDFTIRALEYSNRMINGEDHLIDDILEYLQEWLIKYIQETDVELAEFLKENGIK